MIPYNPLFLSPSWMNEYHTKYPHGLSVMENLIEWVNSVNELIDYVNVTPDKVAEILTGWRTDGVFDSIIDTVILNIKDKQSYFNGVADGNYTTGAGTDNSALLQAAIDELDENGGGVLHIPHGIYKVSFSIKVPSGVSIIGDGKWSTIVFCPTTFVDTTGVFHFNGAGGYPTNFKGLAVLCAAGGCLGAGVTSTKNGVFISDIWINGFQYGMILNSTDNFLSDFAIELCSPYGLVVNNTHINIQQGTLYGCQIGFTVGNELSNEEGEITVMNVRANNCGQTGFEAVNNSKHVTFIGCSVTHTTTEKFTSAGFKVSNSKDIKIIGCEAAIKTGKSLTAKGLDIGNSSDIIVNGFKGYGWLDGVSIDNCMNLSITSSHLRNNGRNGIKVNAGDRISVDANHCIENGTAGEFDSGIYLNNSSGYGLYSVNNNMCTQPGGGVQKYGIYSNVVDNGASSGLTNTLGNVCRFNSVTAIYKTGLLANNISDLNIAL